jgi:hypothetical protein
MTLSYGPVEQSDGIPVTARCSLLWQGPDGVQRHVGFLERLDHPMENAVSYQWATPRLAAATRDEVLDAVVAACQSGDLRAGDKV